MSGNGLDLCGELVQALGLDDESRDVQTLELVTLGRADTAGPEQQQIRFQAEQPLHVQLTVTPHRGQVLEFCRTLTGIQHTHQKVCGAQFNDDFRKRRCKADNAFDTRGRVADGQQQNRQPDRAHQPS
ncbi:hypothetical protein D3C85_1389240 [compost metagenome]